MFDLPKNIKNVSTEPSLYAVVLDGNDKSMIHVGVHFSLDEAVAVATPMLKDLLEREGGELTSAKLGMWAAISARDVLNAISAKNPPMDPSSSKNIRRNSLQSHINRDIIFNLKRYHKIYTSNRSNNFASCFEVHKVASLLMF